MTATTEGCFVRSHHRAGIVIHQPGERPGNPAKVIAVRMLGIMFAGGQVHHYRVADAAGVCYLAPPHWLPPHARHQADWSITHDAYLFNEVWQAYLRDPAFVLHVMKEVVQADPEKPMPAGRLRLVGEPA